MAVAAGTRSDSRRPGSVSFGPTPASVRVSLLGGFELRCGDRLVHLPLSANRLVALLALRDRLTQRAYVSGMLWPEATEARASASLRSLLWRLRRPSVVLVEATSTHLRLAPTVVTDVQELIAFSDRVARRSTKREDADLAAASRYGELLPGWYEDWVLMERERLHQIRLHVLEAMCERLTAAGRFGPAVEAGLAAVAGEPLRESAHRVLIRADLAEGNWADALRHYRMYRQLLRDELGLEPSPLIEDLIRGLGKWRYRDE